MPTKSQNPTPTDTPASRETLVEKLKSHDQIEKVVEYSDKSRLTGVMVILDWVTDSTMENGTRIIHEKQYDDHIRNVNEFVRETDGITTTAGGGKSGIARYTIHVKFTHPINQ